MRKARHKEHIGNDITTSQARMTLQKRKANKAGWYVVCVNQSHDGLAKLCSINERKSVITCNNHETVRAGNFSGLIRQTVRDGFVREFLEQIDSVQPDLSSENRNSFILPR